MPYVPVPKDLNRVKTKLIFNLTTRQVLCFSAGAGLGIAFYFFTKSALGANAAMLGMAALAGPFFIVGVYERNGRGLEKLFMNYMGFRFKYPRYRPYKTQNFYSIINNYDHSSLYNTADKGISKQKNLKEAVPTDE